MRHIFFFLVTLTLISSCKNDKKGAKTKTEQNGNAEAANDSNKQTNKDLSVKDSMHDITVNPMIAPTGEDEKISESAKFIAPDGKQYDITYMDPAPEELKMEEAALDCETDNFHGRDRKAAKISLTNARTESFATLNDFLSTLRTVNDNFMMANSLISKDERNDRVREEKRNVRIVNAFLYAIKREGDNDYHLIIGDGRGTFFNIECSGLPGNNSQYFQPLLKIRNSLESHFGELCSTKYSVFKRGIPVSVSGSLFYDIDHKPGDVGPEGYRPKTAWEVHPITSLEFRREE